MPCGAWYSNANKHIKFIGDFIHSRPTVVTSMNCSSDNKRKSWDEERKTRFDASNIRPSHQMCAASARKSFNRLTDELRRLCGFLSITLPLLSETYNNNVVSALEPPQSRRIAIFTVKVPKCLSIIALFKSFCVSVSLKALPAAAFY